MNKLRIIVSVCAALSLLGVSPALAGHDPDPDAVAADAVVGRPLGLASTIVGSAIFLVSLPVAAISGSVDTTAKALVVKPARFTFTRPLGDFDFHAADCSCTKCERHLAAQKSKGRPTRVARGG